jgi:glycosyltransferase involved in cell wall biosynthesis
VLARCDRVTSDAAVLTQAIAAFGVPSEHILTVPMGVEPGRFSAGAKRAERPFVVLSTRRLERVYAVETLLSSFQLLSEEERGGFELRIAGNGSRERALHHLAGPLPVAFLGWLATADLDHELERAHVYVSTSLSDSTSVSLLEAMAAGCLPVVSDIPANREWVRDGETGLLFACGDAPGLAACLRRAAGDAELRRRAALENRRTIAERANWDANMSLVERLFTDLGG